MNNTLITELVAYLNECTRFDPQWMEDLTENRPRCNDLIARQTPIPVSADPGGRNTRAGVIALLNGFLIPRGLIVRLVSSRHSDFIYFRVDPAKEHDMKPEPRGHGSSNKEPC